MMAPKGVFLTAALAKEVLRDLLREGGYEIIYDGCNRTGDFLEVAGAAIDRAAMAPIAIDGERALCSIDATEVRAALGTWGPAVDDRKVVRLLNADFSRLGESSMYDSFRDQLCQVAEELCLKKDESP